MGAPHARLCTCVCSVLSVGLSCHCFFYELMQLFTVSAIKCVNLGKALCRIAGLQ
mgnify:CR=1 FL=1